MRIIETAYGLFIKRRGKVYEYVGNAWMEVPILTAKQITKINRKVEQLDEEIK
jgi:hypothetical protein